MSTPKKPSGKTTSNHHISSPKHQNSSTKTPAKKSKSSTAPHNSTSTPRDSTPKSLPPKKQQRKEQVHPVLLGLPDGPADEDEVDAQVTKIGGKPNWLLPGQAPSGNIIICDYCGNAIFLLLQAYVPLENSVYDRVIYVWGCNRKQCMRRDRSFRVLRAHRMDEEYAQQLARKEKEKAKKAEAKSATGVLGAGFNFGDVWNTTKDEEVILNNNPSPENASTSSGLSENTSVTKEDTTNKEGDVSSLNMSQDQEIAGAFKQQLNIQSEPPQADKLPWPSTFPAFPSFYLYISEEVLDETFDYTGFDESKYSQYYSIQEEVGEEEAEEGATWTGEVYEKTTLPNGMDKGFKKFAERVAEWPEQCVRYDKGSTPLFYSNSDQVASLLHSASPRHKDSQFTTTRLAPCPYCGGARTFEFQLMPNVLSLLPTERYAEGGAESLLEAAKQATLESKPLNGLARFDLGMEWGTILVFTCENDCNGGLPDRSDEVYYFEELALVQYED
ncbi:uncharacterized protein VTP21DRAFT_3958 [Calcarisporiella thermophila]|uniref:uncharacterized protein n=1 Tax=Calcarisporiella thermophila TaxID=911321 RepID=UPI0037449F01